MFMRLETCYGKVQQWAHEHAVVFDWFVRDRPDTMLTGPPPPLACLIAGRVVYAPPRWAGAERFPELCSAGAQQARRERVAARGMTWGHDNDGYRELCSKNYYYTKWRSLPACLTLSDEFALIPAAAADIYFKDAWAGMR